MSRLGLLRHVRKSYLFFLKLIYLLSIRVTHYILIAYLCPSTAWARRATCAKLSINVLW